MFSLRIESRFLAAHALRLPDGSFEPWHAHDWGVTVETEGEGLDGMECVMDFHELERIVGAVLDPLRGADLNAHGAFAGKNPSAERVAEYVFNAVQPQLPGGVALRRVTVEESPGCFAGYAG